MTNWQQRFLDLAEHVAQWSKDPSTKVGCVIVDRKQRVLSLGYNGFPRGVEDSAHLLEDREAKYLRVQHAEANAITQAPHNLEGANAYITAPPCPNCAGMLIQAGISQVLARPGSSSFQERHAAHLVVSEKMMAEAGVVFSVLEPQN